MSDSATPRQTAADRPDPLPLSALNDFLFCPRRAWLKFVEGLRGTNEHTILGNLAHEHVDFPGYEQRAGWTLLRALPLFSDNLGLSGKADLVEIRYEEERSTPLVSQLSNLKSEIPRRIAEARPVEYKKGPKRRWSNDEVQLCAQALCLEEMLNLAVPSGAIFHAQSQQRHEVTFDNALRRQTLAALTDLRALLAETAPPLAELKPQCDGCSLHGVCLPEAAHRRASRLFEPRQYS